MVFKDITIRCVVCGSDFLFSANEAAFYVEKHFTHLPRRCRFCRQRNKVNGIKQGPIPTEITCSACGKLATVPFQPKDNRPVHCRDCFNKRTQVGENGKKFRGASPEFVKSNGGKMNSETKSIYHRITDNVLFNNESRPQTKTAVENVLAKIGSHLDRADYNALESLEFCAPSHQSPFTTISRGDNPIVLLSCGLEEMSPGEAEQYTAHAFAEGIAVAKGVTRNKISGEVDRLLRTWEYPVTTSRSDAVGA